VLLEQVDAALHGMALLVRLGIERRRPAALGSQLAAVGGLIVLDRNDAPDPPPPQVGPVALRAVRLMSCHPTPGPVGCGRPPSGRGTRMRSSTAVNCGLSPRCPAVIRIASGLRPCSQPRCSLVVQPPRERPKPWSAGSSPPTPPGWFGLQTPLFRAPAARWRARALV